MRGVSFKSVGERGKKTWIFTRGRSARDRNVLRERGKGRKAQKHARIFKMEYGTLMSRTLLVIENKRDTRDAKQEKTSGASGKNAPKNPPFERWLAQIGRLKTCW